MNNIGRLLVRELRLFWLSYIGTMLFFALYSLVLSVTFEDAVAGETGASIIVDMVILLFGQILGLGITKFNLMNLFRTDPYTRKMRVIRRLPVRTSEIAIARVTMMLVMTAVNAVMLIVPAYLVMPGIRQAVTVTELCSLLIFIFLFGSVTGSFYVYMEIGHRARRYLEVSIVGVLLTLLAVYLLWLFDIQLTVSLLEQAREGYHPLLYILALVIAGLAVHLFLRIIIRRLDRRDYYS